jgi:hypothetical protein
MQEAIGHDAVPLAVGDEGPKEAEVERKAPAGFGEETT